MARDINSLLTTVQDLKMVVRALMHDSEALLRENLTLCLALSRALGVELRRIKQDPKHGLCVWCGSCGRWIPATEYLMSEPAEAGCREWAKGMVEDMTAWEDELRPLLPGPEQGPDGPMVKT